MSQAWNRPFGYRPRRWGTIGRRRLDLLFLAVICSPSPIQNAPGVVSASNCFAESPQPLAPLITQLPIVAPTALQCASTATAGAQRAQGQRGRDIRSPRGDNAWFQPEAGHIDH